MLLFALMSVLLLVIAGLAVDAGMSYFSSDQVERAAAAGALADVAYLPGNYAAATNAALVEVARNGFDSACPTTTTLANITSAPAPCVVVQAPTGTTNQLEVTVSVNVPTTFLQLLGFGPHAVVRNATAEYLPPIQLGQPGNQLGSGLATTTNCDGIPTSGTPGGYCATPPSGLGSSGNFYILRSEGWSVDRSEGDGYTPNPNDSANSCGPLGSSDSCAAADTTVNFHNISPLNGTESSGISKVNGNGGQNYLITVPANTTVDVQVYNPSFAPNTDDNNNNADYTLHEDDGDFPDDCSSGNGSACGTQQPDLTKTDYAAMAYTLFSVLTLASDLNDTELDQQVFYPFNATGLESSTLASSSYIYWGGYGTAGSSTKVTGAVPAMFHNWISIDDPAAQISSGTDLNYTNDLQLYQPVASNGYVTNSSSAPEYLRLEVDTLTNTGGTINPLTAAATGYPLAHKAYSVRVVAPGGGSCGTCTVSAMDDMTVYTPVQGGQCQDFQIPIFYLDPAYAGQTITVDLFDVGDVGGGAAFVGFAPPNSSGGSCSTPTAFASMPTGYSIQDLGPSLGSDAYGNESNASTSGAAGNPDAGGKTTDAVIQTAGSTGGTQWNGQWLQFEISVPSSYTLPAGCATNPDNTDCYWNLFYAVAKTATAGDTFSIYAGFNGTPDRLLP
jgi:hypothetical protein